MSDTTTKNNDLNPHHEATSSGLVSNTVEHLRSKNYPPPKSFSTVRESSAPTTETEINELVGSIKHANGRQSRKDVEQRVHKPLGILQEIYRAQWRWSISSHVSSPEENLQAPSSVNNDTNRNFREGVEERLAAAVKKNGTCLEGQICPDVKCLESSFLWTATREGGLNPEMLSMIFWKHLLPCSFKMLQFPVR
ncbi:uncharacterized protein Bfra_002685 [Botrytis fragariae]|uniref:Uncharacterized protein n=1 Tax=Botrytis fragariae TaxID=1964551 RepID=A0A8H6AZC6_9HELO|nr:uncharacterized protein Bfra_002685 [Botrytis fragariae]KAF5876282.1 hypothetical protein Bfra_002685 [Botrytis fragariae]